MECHRDRNFLVTNTKLYNYYQDWRTSAHADEGVTCTDCHGGNPKAKGMEQAHGKSIRPSDPASKIHYTHVTQTCGHCHEDILAGFRQSDHYEHITDDADDQQAPTCVTCHGSTALAVPDLESVEAACARCHDAESGEHAENPAKAKRALNRFLSIDRFYRYISRRIDPDEAEAFFTDVDRRHRKLAVTWHTFDLERIETETDELIAVLKAKRHEIQQAAKAKKAAEKQTKK